MRYVVFSLGFQVNYTFWWILAVNLDTNLFRMQKIKMIIKKTNYNYFVFHFCSHHKYTCFLHTLLLVYTDQEFTATYTNWHNNTCLWWDGLIQRVILYQANLWVIMVNVLTAAISSRGSSQLLRESKRETRSTTFSC